ncbi:extracellular solute-binding protein [Paenibacillus spongiae]|uniref:Extracellular solute-binding protein n=1 Tax=Paenibacillus spongiae TaxID=2909671 RepID=A0ABY5S8B4_9BACL|nr:extracellular solute-binding protein [Paenibacillus spongiae]UVI28770.1 extracellular solute-binding protein [Paenibacillus spongiae]
MPMNKRFVLPLVLILIFVLLTACGGNAVNTGEAKTPNNAAVGSDSNDSPDNKGQAGNSAEVVINVNGADNVAGTGDVDERIKAREDELAKAEKAPTKDALSPVEIAKAVNKIMADQGFDLKQEDWGWSEPLVQKQTTAFIAKTSPDVLTGETQSPGFAAQGLLEPFPDWLEQKVRNEIVEGAWKPMEYDGKIYGVAFQPGVSVLFWNKDLFKKAGLDPEKGPETWDEMLDMAKKINDAGKGKFWGAAIYSGPNNGGYLRGGIYPLIAGGGFVDESNNPIFNAEGNVKAFQFLRDLNQYAPPGVMANTGEGAYWDPVNKGQVGIWAEGPWMVSSCTNLKLDCGMGSLPLSDGGQQANITIGAAFASVSIYSKNKQGGFKFIEAMLSDEVQQIIADAGVRPPVLKKIGESDAYKAAQPGIYKFYEAMAGNVKGLPTFAKENTRVWQIYGEALSKSLMTKTDIKTILDDAQKKAEAILK